MLLECSFDRIESLLAYSDQNRRGFFRFVMIKSKVYKIIDDHFIKLIMKFIEKT